VRRREAELRDRVERLRDDRVEARRVWALRARRIAATGDDLDEHLDAVTRAHARAREELPHHRADREHVGAAIAVARELLRREVAELALDRALLGVLEAIGRLRDAEVGDADRAVDADEHVLRGHVAVDDLERDAVGRLRLVRGVEAREHVARDGRHDVERELRVRTRRGAEDLREIDALDPLHHDGGRARGALDHADHADDVRVANGVRQADFVFERREAARVLVEERVELLHRDVTTVVEAREVHGGRASHTERAHDLESARAVHHGAKRISGRHRRDDTSTAVPSQGKTDVFLRCPLI